MSSHTKRTMGQLRIYQWQLVQPWSREKMGWTYCSSDMKCYISGTSSTVPSSTRTRSETILDILEDTYKTTSQEKMRFLVSRLGTHLSHSTWKVLQSPLICITQITMKSKIYPMWRSHQWKSGTQSRSHSTYETDCVLGSVDPILNEGELARRVIGSVHITDFKESEHNIYGNNRNRKQEQNSHSDEELKLKNQGTNKVMI